MKASLLHMQDPAAQPNWSLSIRRSQVMHALETELGILAGLEDAWLTWRQASAQTEARLKRVLASSRPNYGLHDQVCASLLACVDGCVRPVVSCTLETLIP